MKNLQISAHLLSNVVTDGDMPIDGILADAWMRKNHGDIYYQDTVAIRETDLIEPDLPLATRQVGGTFYYASSFAALNAKTQASGQDYWNKRFDQKETHRLDFGNKKGRVIIESGPYKAYHMPVFYISTLEIRWWVVGDKPEIEDLLQSVSSIGKKRSQGWGAVRNWEVAEIEQDWSCWKDGKPTRTIPVLEEDIASLGGDYSFGWRGYRAPYWHASRQALVVLPSKEALCWQ